MRTEDLIIALAADVRPVRLVAPLGTRLARWSAGALGGMAIVMVVFGLRADVATIVRSGAWEWEWVAVLVLMGLAAVAMQLSAVPGAAGGQATRLLTLVAFGAWGALVVRRLGAEGAPWAALAAEPAHLACVLRMAVAAVVPGAVAWRQLRRAAPLEPVWSAALVALSGLAAGAAAVALVCPLDAPSHALLWHVLPVAAVVSTVAAAAAWATRRP